MERVYAAARARAPTRRMRGLRVMECVEDNLSSRTGLSGFIVRPQQGAQQRAEFVFFALVHEPIIGMAHAIRVLLLALPALAQACLGFRW
jgi:hypothetical protein